MGAGYFLEKKKVQWIECGGRLLLDDNTRGGAVNPAADQVTVYWCLDSNWNPFYVYLCNSTWAEFDLGQIFRDVATVQIGECL